MKLRLILWINLLFSFSLYAQQVTVKEAESQNPIVGVIITSENKSVTTNFEGKASLSSFSENALLTFQSKNHNMLIMEKKTILELNMVVFMEMSVKDLDEVVISASKFEQSKRDIPQKIVNISANTIAFANPQTSAD